MGENSHGIEFLESHRPPLLAGQYRVSVEQAFSEVPGQTDRSSMESFGGQNYEFSVAGPKFLLSPQDIASTFPPPGSLGDHSNVFPHVAFHRSTLPWERSAEADPSTLGQQTPGLWKDAAPPWLALLIFDDDDIGSGHIRPSEPQTGKETLTVADLNSSSDAGGCPPHKVGEGDIVVNAIDVKTTQLHSFFPTAIETRLLCHVRRNILFTIPWMKNKLPHAWRDSQSRGQSTRAIREYVVGTYG